MTEFPNEFPMDEASEIPLDGPMEGMIRLADYLKFCGVVGTGGHAKILIQSGEVRVNGQVETRRRRQLHCGDRVELLGETFTV